MKLREWYFTGEGYFLRVLRFLNLLEPDRPVLSMTKVLLWGTTIQSLIIMNTADNLVQVAGALGLNLAAMAKHEVRRKAQGEE